MCIHRGFIVLKITNRNERKSVISIVPDDAMLITGPRALHGKYTRHCGLLPSNSLASCRESYM